MEKTISRSLNNEKNCWLQPYEWSHTRLINDQKCILILNCNCLQGCSQAVNPCLKTKRKCGTWSVSNNSADEYDIEQNAMWIKQSRCRHPDLVLKLYTHFPSASQISYWFFLTDVSAQCWVSMTDVENDKLIANVIQQFVHLTTFLGFVTINLCRSMSLQSTVCSQNILGVTQHFGFAVDTMTNNLSQWFSWLHMQWQNVSDLCLQWFEQCLNV